MERYRWQMETAQPEGLLGLTIIVATSLVVLVYVLLRMAGVLGHRHGDHQHQGLHEAGAEVAGTSRRMCRRSPRAT